MLQDFESLPDSSLQDITIEDSLINIALAGRGPNYLTNGVSLNKKWIETLDIVAEQKLPEITMAIGAGLDSLYDFFSTQCESNYPYELERFINETVELTDPFKAKEFLLAHKDQQQLDLHSGVLYLIAHMTYQGSVRLIEEPLVLYLWLEEWQRSLVDHGLLELEKFMNYIDSSLPITLPISQIPVVNTLEAGITEYEIRYDKTSGLPVAMMPIYPFVLYASDDHTFHEYTSIVRRLSGVSRIAQDIIIDLSEPMNAGIFALYREMSAEYSDLTIADVIQKLRQDTSALERVQSELRNHVERVLLDLSSHYANMRHFLQLFSSLCEIVRIFESRGLRG